MNVSSTNLKIWSVPLRGWPVRGLHVLVSSLGKVPGVILVSEQAAQEVEKQLRSLQLTHEQLEKLCTSPQDLQAFINQIFPDLNGAFITPEVCRLLETMDEIGWSQAKLARKLQIDPNTVSRWVTGRSPVPAWALEYLSALKAIKDLAKGLDL